LEIYALKVKETFKPAKNDRRHDSRDVQGVKYQVGDKNAGELQEND